MPEVIFNGPEGRLEGRYHHNKVDDAPIALILHPDPKRGGNMNHKVVFTLYQTFARQGFSVLRFNFRGVGRSQGQVDDGTGELADAASALDWLQAIKPNAQSCWVAGFSFGAWIGMQLLMRRPELEGFVSVAPPAGSQDFTFLAPCPSSGLIVHGNADAQVPETQVAKLANKLAGQKKITVDYAVIDGADHYFQNHTEALEKTVGGYLRKALVTAAAERVSA